MKKPNMWFFPANVFMAKSEPFLQELRPAFKEAFRETSQRAMGRGRISGRIRAGQSRAN
jgi:hypothetical protein